MARKLRPEERELWKKVADTATPLAPPEKMEMPRALSMSKAKIERPASVQPDLKGFKIGAKSRSTPLVGRGQAAGEACACDGCEVFWEVNAWQAAARRAHRPSWDDNGGSPPCLCKISFWDRRNCSADWF